jgi:hypothetical protein
MKNKGLVSHSKVHCVSVYCSTIVASEWRPRQSRRLKTDVPVGKTPKMERTKGTDFGIKEELADRQGKIPRCFLLEGIVQGSGMQQGGRGSPTSFWQRQTNGENGEAKSV